MTTINMVYPTTAMHGGIVSVTTDESKGDNFPDNLDTVMVDWPGTLTGQAFSDVSKRLEIIRTSILSDDRMSYNCDELHLYTDSIVKCATKNSAIYKQLRKAVVSSYKGTLSTVSGGGFLSGCTGLTSLTLPDTLSTVSGGGFLSGCTGLTSLTLPDTLSTVSGGGFLSGCTGLRTLVMPSGLTNFNTTAFLLDKCTKTLTDLTLPMQSMQQSSVWSTHLAAGATVRVPASLLGTYRADSTWVTFNLTAIA